MGTRERHEAAREAEETARYCGFPQEENDPDYHDLNTDPQTRVFDAEGKCVYVPVACNTRTGWVLLHVMKDGVFELTNTNEVRRIEQHVPAPLTLKPFRKQDNAPLEEQNTLFVNDWREVR